MKKGINLLKLLALILALIMAVAMFVACDDGEKKVFYNEDGTLDREEYYYEDGTLKKVRVQIHDFYNVNNFEEIYYSQSGKVVSEIHYSGMGDFNEEKECMNYVYYHKNDFDENGNFIKSTTYMDTDVSFTFDENDSFCRYADFKYDSDNKIIKSILYDNNGIVIKWTDFEYDSEKMLVKETVYKNDNSFEYVVEYDPEKMSDIGLGISFYNDNLSYYYTTPMYEQIDENGKFRNNYESILKMDSYRDNGVLYEHLERVAENRIVIIRYNDDGTIASEKTIDYKGNKIE